MQEKSFALIIISNGPGELSTWVRPVVEKLYSKLRISPNDQDSPIKLQLVLVPCPNAHGNELEMAKKWGFFEKIIPAKNFWDFLLRPNKYSYWPSQGLVVFLGGDQFWSVLLSKRLGYLHLTYAEWLARWPLLNDRIAAMSEAVKAKLSSKSQKKCTVVGDLMADIEVKAKESTPIPRGSWIALMPGSKSAKLSIGIPLFLDVADRLHGLIPNCKFLLPVAPTTNVDEFLKFTSSKNPISRKYNSSIEEIQSPSNNEPWRRLITKKGTVIYLDEKYPAYEHLSQCKIAITTVGANTAELGALAVPMLVVIPTQHLYVMKAWDGLLGLLSRLPVFKWFLGILITLWKLRKRNFFAWPNISAGRMIVPERIGIITPSQIACEVADWINNPERLKGQKEDLKSLRGNKGAAENMAKEILKLIERKINLKYLMK